MKLPRPTFVCIPISAFSYLKWQPNLFYQVQRWRSEEDLWTLLLGNWKEKGRQERDTGRVEELRREAKGSLIEDTYRARKKKLQIKESVKIARET